MRADCRACYFTQTLLFVAAKNLPVHCVVETIHNIVESHVSNSREKWRSPQVETDSYVIIPVAMPFQVRITFLYHIRHYYHSIY